MHFGQRLPQAEELILKGGGSFIYTQALFHLELDLSAVNILLSTQFAPAVLLNLQSHSNSTADAAPSFSL